MFTFALGSALGINGAQPPILHTIMTVDEFEKQIKEKEKTSLRAINDENAYAAALWDADPERVKFFLDRNSKASGFRIINRAKQFVGKGAEYVEKTPLDIVWYNNESDKNDRWAVYELLFKYGADADNSWRNTRLKWATSFQPDPEFAQWLIAHGARK